jgi:hypothetical protein
MSKLLIRMLKISVLPAATMIVAKVVGLVVAVTVYDIELFISNDVGGPFSVQILVGSSADTLLVNSVSNLILLITMTVINAYLFGKYILYVKTKDNPRTIVKLTKFNLLKWVTAKDSVFLRIFIWILFLLATCAVIITSTLRGETYQGIGLAAFLIAIFFMWGLIRSFEVEIAKIYPKGKNALY